MLSPVCLVLCAFEALSRQVVAGLATASNWIGNCPSIIIIWKVSLRPATEPAFLTASLAPPVLGVVKSREAWIA